MTIGVERWSRADSPGDREGSIGRQFGHARAGQLALIPRELVVIKITINAKLAAVHHERCIIQRRADAQRTDIFDRAAAANRRSIFNPEPPAAELKGCTEPTESVDPLSLVPPPIKLNMPLVTETSPVLLRIALIEVESTPADLLSVPLLLIVAHSKSAVSGLASVWSAVKFHTPLLLNTAPWPVSTMRCCSS